MLLLGKICIHVCVNHVILHVSLARCYQHLTAAFDW